MAVTISFDIPDSKVSKAQELIEYGKGPKPADVTWPEYAAEVAKESFITYLKSVNRRKAKSEIKHIQNDFLDEPIPEEPEA